MSNPIDREVAVFSAARRLPAGERAAYLDEACAGDAALRQRVEELLQASEEAGGFLQDPAPGAQRPADALASPNPLQNVAATGQMVDNRVGLCSTVMSSAARAAPGEKVGDRIGRYKLLQQIGEGGCGVVYMAEQEEPVRRRVALKVIKLGMDTKQVVARFEAERQALALMDHPHIAKVLEAGATDTGRPYFVMELVRGIKITHYCDENNLSTRERLDLFIKVAQAVQHAHQKGIIHRDLKPSNVLVADHDGVPVPKVIDFGIAKATTDQRLTDKTLFTAFEQFIGTPAYMSPEQARMSGLDIDTRTDIYSLGVLLYELLTGKTPFDAEDLLAAGLEEMRRTISEKEAARPSTRLSTMLEGELTTTAKHRHTDAPKLVHLIRGDLDWIVMKALEKDRARRYETANGLATDIERHLNNEPVVARPPSNLYRFQKLVRRNKLAFAAGAAVAIALVLGVMASTWQAIRATRSEREQSRLRSHAEASQKKSETEAAKATAISDFLQEMLRSANPDNAKGSEYTVRQLLDDFSAGLDTQLAGQPEVEAAVRATIGRAYNQLGFPNKAQAQVERALALRRRIFGDQSEQVAECLVDYAWICFEQEQNAKGESHVREALGIYRKHGTAGKPVISALLVLQRLLIAEGRYTEVEMVTEEASAIKGEFPELASMIHGLAEVKDKQSKYAEGESLALRAVAMHRHLHGVEHPETAWALISVGIARRGQQKWIEAESALQEALTIFRKHYSSGHSSVDHAMWDLALVLEAKGDPAAAEALYHEILAARRGALGNDSPAVAETLNRLAASFQSQGRPAEAEKALREAVEIMLKVRDQDPAGPPSVVLRLVSLLEAKGDSAAVEALYREVLAGQRAALGNACPAVVETLVHLAASLQSQGKSAEAEMTLREALDISLKLRDQNFAQLPRLLRRLAKALKWQAKSRDAEKLYEETIQVVRQALGESHAALGEMLHDFGEFLNHENKWKEAAEQYINSLPIRRAQQNDNLAWTLRNLGGVLIQARRPKDAEPYLREALALHRKLHQQEDINGTAWTAENLADALYQQQKLPEAEQVYREALVAYSKTEGIGGNGYTRVSELLVRVLGTDKAEK